MEKLRMQTADITVQNIENIEALFPNVITEKKDKDGKLTKAINFDLLKQMLSADIVDDDEAYEFTWIGKKASIVEAHTPIRKTLRPCKDESKDWDSTENVYIEGDNIEVLKLLQESYLGKIKMIYIDPPYNTGKDSFVYPDNYTMDKDEYEEEIEYRDEDGNIQFRQNNESNPRFHSDWCSMIYSRLKLARNLLSEDGVIFISIDDNEQANLKTICDEIFGASNFIANVIWQRAFSPKNDAKYLSENHDYILIYTKNINCVQIGKLPRTQEANERYTNLDNDSRGVWMSGDLTVKTYSEKYDYTILTPSGREVLPSDGRCWNMSKENIQQLIADNRIWFGANGNNVPRLKRFLSDVQDGLVSTTLWLHQEVGHNQEGRQEVKKLFDDKGYFDGPKPVRLLSRILQIANTHKNSIILDFFSGSATTAHAVMQLNAEDGGNRKFIMVQLPEECKENSEAHKAGYANICEIGKERIRRAGEQIKEEIDKENAPMVYGESTYSESCYSGKLIQKEIPDIGFRVFKVADSYMKDVFYGVDDYSQDKLSDLADNIEADRSDLDLLYGTLLAWGTPTALSMPHKQEILDNCTIHTIHKGERIDLIACFDNKIPESVISVIAKRKPLRAVFRDSSFATSADRINVEEIFKLYSPDTRVKVL